MNKRWYALAVSSMIFTITCPVIFPNREQERIEEGRVNDGNDISNGVTNYSNLSRYTNSYIENILGD